MAKKKAATMMYEKIKMSENYSIENMCIDNGVIDRSCIVTSAGIDDKLFMATAIDSISHRSIDANKVQPPQLTNESREDIKHNINCLSTLSTTRTTPIDLEVKLTGNESVIVNKKQQSMFASVDVNFAKRFRRSNNSSVRELKVIAIRFIRPQPAVYTYRFNT
jgi:hypothetical protein